MELQDKGFKSIDTKVETKEGEHEPLSCNKANVRSPSLEYIPTLSSEGIDKAFDLLFEEVISNKTQSLWKQQN